MGNCEVIRGKAEGPGCFDLFEVFHLSSLSEDLSS